MFEESQKGAGRLVGRAHGVLSDIFHLVNSPLSSTPCHLRRVPQQWYTELCLLEPGRRCLTESLDNRDDPTCLVDLGVGALPMRVTDIPTPSRSSGCTSLTMVRAGNVRACLQNHRLSDRGFVVRQFRRTRGWSCAVSLRSNQRHRGAKLSCFGDGSKGGVATGCRRSTLDRTMRCSTSAKIVSARSRRCSCTGWPT